MRNAALKKREKSTVGWAIQTSVVLVLLLVLGKGIASTETSPTVLHIASERHTSLALNYAYFPQFASLGFGTPTEPWHPWFGTKDIQTLLYLPDYQPGQPVQLHPHMIIGSRFGGKDWSSGFEALGSFDADQNGIVERDELNDLYVWADINSNGNIVAEPQWFFPSRSRYAGFDLRHPVRREQGYARTGHRAPFAVIGRQTSRIHLLELTIQDQFAKEHLGYLSYTLTSQFDPNHAFSGDWRWTTIDTQPPSRTGRLILAAHGSTIRGIVQYRGAHNDRINLPLEGIITAGKAEWTSVSPLGLTRSAVTLSQELGKPVLQSQAWSNRNGKVDHWTWKAHYVNKLE